MSDQSNERDGDRASRTVSAPQKGPPKAKNGGQRRGGGLVGKENNKRRKRRARGSANGSPKNQIDNTNPREVYGALDLGTNNCRLLLARPSRRGFQVVDAFSRIIRLGEGVSRTGQLSEAAMHRTQDALKVCASKLRRHNVTRARLVATEACRIAENGMAFLEQIHSETGLQLEILNRETEARLAVSGCASLIDVENDFVLVFDIGGGSSEIIWLDLTSLDDRRRLSKADRAQIQNTMLAWTSLPVGVVTLAEKYGGRYITPEIFEAMVDDVLAMIQPFEDKYRISERISGRPVHFMGTSGTVTTLAGVQLGLRRYDRKRVDGYWLDVAEAQDVTEDLLLKSFDERVAEPCIGSERADLVLAGCAILEGLIRSWPCPRLRVADRGLREGILTTLMTEDGVYSGGQRRRSKRSGRRRSRSRKSTKSARDIRQ